MIHCVGLNLAIDRILSAPGFAAGQHCRATLRILRAAGKAANLARVLGRLGVSARLAGFVGAREEVFFAERFRGLPVEVDLLPLEAPTRINTTILDSRGGTETHLRESGSPVQPEAFARLAGELRGGTKAGDLVAFAGSLPPGISAAEAAALLRELSEAGRKVVADASGEWLAALRGLPLFLLKPNREELSTLLDEPVRTHADLRALALTARQRVGAEELLVSDGSYGAGLFGLDGALWGEPPGWELRSTVGAGDALLAGFLAALAWGEGREGCLAHALAAAQNAIAQEEPGEVDPDAVESLRAAVRITAL